MRQLTNDESLRLDSRCLTIVDAKDLSPLSSLLCKFKLFVSELCGTGYISVILYNYRWLFAYHLLFSLTFYVIAWQYGCIY